MRHIISKWTEIRHIYIKRRQQQYKHNLYRRVSMNAYPFEVQNLQFPFNHFEVRLKCNNTNYIIFMNSVVVIFNFTL